MGQGRLPRRAHCDQVKTEAAPQLVVGRSPTSSFPFPVPMDEVHGIISIRFAEVPCALPMLSPFRIGSSCGKRESFRTRILGSYNKTLFEVPLCLTLRY